MDPSFVFVFTCDHILPKKVGPVLGALLYKAAGFCLPFALTGTAILLSGFQVLVVTKMPSMASSNSSTSPQSSSSLAILSKPTVLIGLATATAGAYSIGTVEATVFPFIIFKTSKYFHIQATLSPFLSTSLDLPITKIALAFLVMSLCSVLATPFFGWLCDSKVSCE